MSEVKKPKPNRLIHEKSPYLLQHAYNPVDWYAWGEEAFEKAAREDKLVFLSIGYATCHWCHVMERESFEDDETAAVLKEHFVAIKVDREERPDLDSIYMDALHAMGQQGGWPLNLFLTPKKSPVFGGTYFPPTPRYGMRSFKEILIAASDAWHTKKEKLIDASNDVANYLINSSAERPDTGLPSEESPENAFHLYESLYDQTNYGFATDSRNKFPPSMALSFLMSHYYRTGASKAIDMVEATLNAMKKGGIYDQIGGGLCRYSTDHTWLVPHFEKMLYDNALFLRALVECFQLTNNAFFRQAAYDIIGYIERDMAVPGGGIASAEDADSEGEEGKFYLWSLEEFREVTGDDSQFLEELWHVTAQGNFEGKNILHEDIHTPPQLHDKAQIITANREKLLTRRSARPRPLRDDKVLTSWNCLYIQALVKAGMAFGDQELIRSAESLYSFIKENLFDQNGRLMRRYRDGEVGVLGYLSDYAELGLASFELFRATSDTRYVRMAQRLADDAIRLFKSDFGPFFETGTDAEGLIRRTINGYDGVEPAGNSSMAKLLLLLSATGIESETYSAVAEGIFRHFKNELEKQPISCPAMLQAYTLYLNPPAQIVLIGKQDNSDIQQSLAFFNKNYLGDAIILWSDPDDLITKESDIPMLAGKTATGDFSAYVCVDRTCKPPVSSYEELRGLFK